MRCVAVDWSGRSSDAGEFMWIAEARGGELVIGGAGAVGTGSIRGMAHLLERAAGSEDAFDAAVSALVMSAHADSLSALPGRPNTPQWALEGLIWTPGLRPGS